MAGDKPVLDAAFYDLTQEIGGAIFGAMLAAQARSGEAPDPPTALLQVRRGYAESPAWFLVQAGEFAPEPLTVAGLRMRDVYASERIVAALLEMMASEQWLDRDEAGAYHLTEAGRAQAQRLRPRQHTLIAAIEPPAGLQLERLAGLLDRVVEASQASAEPPGAWCLVHSRRRAPAAGAPALVRIFQYVEDINAFRDDAHMAAWRPLGVEGHAWEAFSLVCGGQAGTAARLFEQLAHRGYSRGEYAAALEDLARRGWLERFDTEAYRAAEAGQAVRAEVEQRTDAYFYAPWSCLSGDAIAEAHALLLRLRDGLQEASSQEDEGDD
jgi:helix-turn-helix protein